MNIGLSNETENSAKQAGRTASNAGRAAVKHAKKQATKKAAKEGVKAGAKTAAKATGPVGWAISIGLDVADKLGLMDAIKGLLICFLCVIIVLPAILVTNTSNISFDVVTHVADDLLHPFKETESHDDDSIKSDIQNEDIKYAEIIVDAMATEHEELEDLIRYECKRQGVDYEASKGNIVDNTIIPQISMAVETSMGGEIIAQTAESLAWPEGSTTKQYDWDEGGAPTDAFKTACSKHAPSWTENRYYKAACCCHSTRIIIAEATGKLPGNLLPNTEDASKAKAELESSTKDMGFEIFAWDGKESSLQRGDVISYAKKGGGGHVWTYLGEGRHADGGRTNNTFSHITKSSNIDEDPSNFHYIYVLRLKSSVSALNPNDFVTDQVYIGEATGGEIGIKNNRAGDQPGHEVMVSQHYGNSWTHVYRAKDPVTRLRIADAAKKGAANNHIGYDQVYPDRKTAYNEAKRVNWQLDKITRDCETTCSEFVNICLRAAGISEEYAPGGSTYVYVAVLGENIERSGKFEKIAPSEAGAQPGDILQTDGHSAVVVSSPNKINVPTSAMPSSGAFGQKVAQWVKKTVAMKKYRYKNFASNPPYSTQCPICHPGSGDGWNCIGFSWAAWHHGAGINSRCDCGVIDNGTGDRMLYMSEAEASQTATQHAGVQCKVIKNTSGIPESSLQAGDIILFFTGDEYKHSAVYIGNGEYGESSGGDALVSTTKYAPSHGGMTVKLAIRYAGPGADSVAGMSNQLQSYDSITTLETLSKKTGDIVYLPNYSGLSFQSFAYNNGNYYFQNITRGRYGTGGYVRVGNEKGTIKNTSNKLALRHGNGFAFCTADGKLYSATTTYTGNNRKLLVISPFTLRLEDVKDIGVGCSSIAYDKTTNRFILAGGGDTVHIYDSTLSSPVGCNSFSKMRNDGSPGDCGAANGIIYIPLWEGEGVNHLDMYSEDTGDYLGSYECPYNELESALVNDEGKLVLLFDDYPSYMQFTDLALNPGQANGMNVELAARSRDVMTVVSAFSVFEAQLLPTQENVQLGEEQTGMKFWVTTILKSLRNKIRRDVELPATLRMIFKTAERTRRDTHQTTLFEISIAEPEEIDGKMVSPLIEVNPAGGEKLCKLFKMDPKGKYETEAPQSLFGSTRKKGENYEIGDTTVESAIETNTDTHLELLYEDLNGEIEKTKLVLPIKNLLTTIKLTKTFAQDKKGIVCEPGKKVKVYACERGEVNKVIKNDPEYGNCIIIQGHYKIVYAHLDSVTVKQGDMVSKNKVIGTASSKFRLNVYEDGKTIDPEPLFIHREFGLFRGGLLGSFGAGNASIADAAVSIAYETRAEAIDNDGTPEYRSLFNQIINDGYYRFCDHVVCTAVRWAGADDSYKPGNCGVQLAYLQNSPKWQKVTDLRGESSLQPGDILINTGHTVVYVGNAAVKKRYPNSDCNLVMGSGDGANTNPGNRSAACQKDKIQGNGGTVSLVYDGRDYYVYRNVAPETNSRYKNLKP